MKRACAGLAALLAFAIGPVWADALSARYDAPTTRYAHGVLGDAEEWGALVLSGEGRETRITLPEVRVFEDIAPRLVMLPGGMAAMVVESHRDFGARLALYHAEGLIAATPYIGMPNRWLAPIGAGDLDGDGRVEIAYIDRPHLAKRLRVWRFDGTIAAGGLTHVADLEGLTNHKIGWEFIAGGLRECGSGPEMITADDAWARVMATVLRGGVLTTREIGRYGGPDTLEAALSCP